MIGPFFVRRLSFEFWHRSSLQREAVTSLIPIPLGDSLPVASHGKHKAPLQKIKKTAKGLSGKAGAQHRPFVHNVLTKIYFL
jgi:hypothetical protein